LIGFGKSDKPTLRENYTYANHVSWVKALLDTIDLQDVTLFCQHWCRLFLIILPLLLIELHGAFLNSGRNPCCARSLIPTR